MIGLLSIYLEEFEIRVDEICSSGYYNILMEANVTYSKPESTKDLTHTIDVKTYGPSLLLEGCAELDDKIESFALSEGIRIDRINFVDLIFIQCT